MADKTPPKKGRPRGSGSFPWRAFFQQSTTPVFVLGKGRRLRFANPAWEKLTGVRLPDAIGLVCSARRQSSALAAALAPTPEAESGRSDRSRRAAPGARAGTQWWDISFMPLASEDGLHGIVGFITVVGDSAPHVVRKLPTRLAALREKQTSHYTLDLFAGESPASERFVTQLRHAAQSSAPLWIIGEPGSGKETAARAIHHSGPNRERAFIAVDSAGLQPFLVESLLFGHGGLLASGQVGMLYLKDPTALPRDLQQRLADHFMEIAGAPRLISGSIRSAADEVAAGNLVGEFHTALSVLELHVPPLRERMDDLGKLISFLRPETKVESDALDVLCVHHWPGNLRELVEALAEAAISANGGAIKRDHLPRELRLRAGVETSPTASKPLALDSILEEVEKRLIRLALRRANNHQTEAADHLGIFRARLWRRLEALGIPVPPQPPKPRKREA